MIEQLVDTLKAIFESTRYNIHIKEVGMLTYRIENFNLRFEKYTQDILLYVQPEFIDAPEGYTPNAKAQRSIEHQLDNKLHKYGITQIIIPYRNFFEMLNEAVQRTGNKKDKELSGFIYAKLKHKIFRLKQLKSELSFKAHAYSVENGVLYFQVRDFSIVDEAGVEKDIPAKNYRKVIETEVFDYIFHLGIKKATMIVSAKKKNGGEALINESADDDSKLKFVEGKKFTNYLTAEGMLTFEICNPVMEDGVLKFAIKKFHATKDGKTTYEMNSSIKSYINMIVSDEVAKYNFKKVEFTGLENTTIS